MHNNLHKKKKSKVVEARSDNNEPDEKKTRLENVDQSALSFLETCKNFVKLNMNSMKNVDKIALDNVEGLNKQGNICFIFLHYERKTTECIFSQRKIPDSNIFVRLYLTTLLRCRTALQINKAEKKQKKIRQMNSYRI